MSEHPAPQPLPPAAPSTSRRATPDPTGPTPPTRELLHHRRIDLHGYRRSDGCYDIEGELRDTKTYDRAGHAGLRAAGEPIHQMRLRLSVDRGFRIVDAHAESLAVPYPGFCETIAPVYQQLIGMTIQAGFMRDIRTLFGGVQGCTHLTELIGCVATAAFQTLSDELAPSDTAQPFQLDGCHALRTDGAAVQMFYPRWFRHLPQS